MSHCRILGNDNLIVVDNDFHNDNNNTGKNIGEKRLAVLLLLILLSLLGVYIWTFIKIILLCPTVGIINLFLALLFFLLK